MTSIYAFLSRLLAIYDATYTAADARLSRVVFFGLFLVTGYKDYSTVAGDGALFRDPPFLSPAFFIGSLPPFWVLQGLTILTGVSAVLALVGYRPVLSTVVFCVSLVTGLSFVYSFGKVDHGEIFIPIVAALGACCGWGQRPRAWMSVGAFYFLTMFVIGLAFFAAGLPKLASGWMNPSDQHFKYVLINYAYGLNQSSGGQWLLVNIHSAFVWEALDWLAVIFELGLIVLIVRPRWFLTGVLVCIAFHYFNAVLLGIYFWHSIAVYLLLLPLSRVQGGRATAVAIGGTIALVAILSLTTGEISLAALLQTLKLPHVWFPLTALSFALLYVVTWQEPPAAKSPV